GGIQLGTGGLARAYGGGANNCLQQAERLPLFQRSSFHHECSFSELALVKLRLTEGSRLLESENLTANGLQMAIAIGPE
ncbi:thymidylate synthase, partial [Pseudomonas syringae pv. tagetis]